GDTIMIQAESLAAAGQKADAAILIAKATSMWSAAVPPTTATVVESIPARTDSVAGPEGNVIPAPVPRTESDSAPPPAPSDSLAVVEFYGELQRAIESRQLGEVARLLPNLTDRDVRDWRSLFDDDDIRFLSAPFQVLNVTRDGQLLYARVRSTITITHYDGKVERKRRSLDYVTLTLGPRGWRQIRSQPVK
ncbi:MAG TPA: hypothetical protein VNH46_05350, partial [Gemmatimonadales bacterium]|nr:hypothetical protein [Gemmatimonadales bacterium]